MKNAQWYYKEMDKLEQQLKECSDPITKEQLEKKLDALHNELYDLDY